MKKVTNCVVENCIPTPSSCVEWNGGDIEYLGICNGDSLNNLVMEIVGKLQDIAGEDLSQFDIESLADICSQKAPNEVTLLGILNLLKNTNICLKDYVTTLQTQISELSNEKKVNVDLKCFADFDNLGNALSITRDQLDQLVINQLCSQKSRLDSIEGELIIIKNELGNTTYSVQEPSFPIACLGLSENVTSEQVKKIAEDYCDFKDTTGTQAELISSFSAVPTYPSEVTANPNYINSAANLADHFNNLLLAYKNLLDRVVFMEENCCAASCDDISLGFTATFSEDNGELLILFSWGAGTSIPAGFTDKGSIGTITDKDGNTQDFSIDIVDNNATAIATEIPISGVLNLNGELTISITAKIGTDSLNCQKCVTGKVRTNPCSVCTVCVDGTNGSSVTIIYESATIGVGGTTTTTTAAPTTTTTTEATTTTTAP